MNICMISDDFVPSKTGVGIHTRSISKELARRGHRVYVITTRRKGQPEREEWHGVRVYRTFSIDVLDFRISLAGRRTIKSILLENEIELIHYQYAGILLKRTFAASRAMNGIKHVYTYNMTIDHLTQDARLMKLFAPKMKRMLVKFCNACDLVTVPSDKLIGQLQRNGVTARLAYVSNAVGLERFDECEPHARASNFVVLFAGRLHPEKNVPYLLEAFKEFNKAHPDSELWLVGDGYLRERLEAMCEEWDIADRVKFMGHVDHEKIPEFYAAADVFVLPSLVEVQPLAAIEAMYYGKAVIVSDSIISAAELVNHGINGFIVDHNSVEDLAEKLTRLKEDDELRNCMSEASQVRAGLFSTTKIVDHLESLYAELATASGRLNR